MCTIQKKYKVLRQQEFSFQGFRLIPIRYEDRFKIMKWRNEQMYHLRQNEPLTEQTQEEYFKNVVSKLFDLNQPDQILFSFLKEDICVGYGGLVHINWIDQNAEISFLINTELEKKYFHEYWSNYLRLIEKIGFKYLFLHKLFVFAFDIRENLYSTLKANNYFLDAILREHHFYNGIFIDVVIYSKLK